MRVLERALGQLSPFSLMAKLTIDRMEEKVLLKLLEERPR
jgi:hypothetical protein